MSYRIVRAVLPDVHGVIVEKKTEDGDPRLVGERGRVFWAECATRAVVEILQVEVRIDPREMWETRCDLEFRLPRTRDGRVIPQRDWWDQVNRLLLEQLLPGVMSPRIPFTRRVRVARKMRVLHREDHTEHMMYPDVRALVHWMHDLGLRLYPQTAQEDFRVWDLVRRANVPASCIAGLFTTQRLGRSKLIRGFWDQILRELNLEPHQVVVIGNNVIQDAFCTEAGIPALILDRDGELERWCRARGDHLRGVQLLRNPDEIPSRAPFIAFERSPKQLQRWLMAMMVGGGVA